MTDARMRTPKLVPGRGDLREIPLSPTDGFILSRIDGVSNEQQIVAVTGLSGPDVQASLAKLELLGVVHFDGAPTAARNASTTSAAASSAEAAVAANRASGATNGTWSISCSDPMPHRCAGARPPSTSSGD